LTGKAASARGCIRKLADPNNRKAAEDRKRFQKTFRYFANVERVQRGPSQSEITASSAARDGKVGAIEHLQKLYTILCRICQCPLSVANSRFKTNLALDLITQTNGADEDLTIEMFILHQHTVDPQEYNVWKEVCLKIFHERYVVQIPLR
jgi:hypothetical protein